MKQHESSASSGNIITFKNEPHYHIAHVDRMESFLMTLVNPYDHWLFQSSRGGCTMGRGDANTALLPYYTDDKLHAFTGQQGPAAQFWVQQGEKEVYWAAFHVGQDPFQQVERHLYKHVYGHQVTFEEHHHTLDLTYRFTWQVSEDFGFILHTELINQGNSPVRVKAMQGVRQVLPAGVKQNMQDLRSNLMSAYKKNEWYGDVALFRLSAIPIDRAEPAEALQANTAFALGAKKQHITLRDSDWDAFAQQTLDKMATETKGDNGAFLVTEEKELSPGATHELTIVLNTNQQAHHIESLHEQLKKQDVMALIQAQSEKTSEDLERLLATTDGLQWLGDKATQYRHANNVMFNNMRGGLLFSHTYCPVPDIAAYLHAVNSRLAKKHQSWLRQLPDPIPLEDLRQAALQTGDSDLIRLLTDYMPIGFSRRHGDPSRPWNAFNIRIKDDAGYNVLYYEGNWRDIFQNWEALSHSYPELLPGMVSKFWNTTTIDGYNPYRVEKNGVDWEILEPHDDWSYVGYWGDHQIVYQTKLLERWQAAAPGEWLQWLDKQWFVCPDVPYRIKDDQALFANASDTIEFDQQEHSKAMKRADTMGWDGKNRVLDNGEWLKLNGLEKLLVTISAKLDNLIPGVGIWMNTQRPEWNDANNALVGRGASAVTVYQLRKHIAFLKDHLVGSEGQINVAEAIADHWRALIKAMEAYNQHHEPMAYLLAAAKAGAAYRRAAYAQQLGNTAPVELQDLVDQLDQCLDILDHTIAANLRPDGLYHSYHLVHTDGKTLETEPLYLMLEGQASVLDAGVLDKEAGLQLLQALRESELYEPRQNSYLLYPNRTLSTFMDRNQLAADQIENHPWLVDILAQPNQKVLVKNPKGYYHFHAQCINANALEEALAPYRSLGSYTTAQEQSLSDLYEEQFHHRAFTGRSGTFYGYEGLGSIYWHMVSKLVLATQQELLRWKVGQDNEVDKKLRSMYADLRDGIGWNKSPEIYGAVPLDPYSHTPYQKGAKQPGMTGQVKEDIIARFGDLGVCAKEGHVSFQPALLPDDWWCRNEDTFTWPNPYGDPLTIHSKEGYLAFTYSGVLIVYYRSQMPYCENMSAKVLSKGESVQMASWLKWRGTWVAIQI